ncbi:MAG: hypothetical protein ACK5UE_01335 [Chitinophagales bacterium]|jgi:hypothetical protein|nr:hypothetical protein [Sphingobacteriales bacterium]
MEITELKEKIHLAIDKENDSDRLDSYYQFIQSNGVWNDLSSADKEELIYMAENKDDVEWIEHSVVMEPHIKWLGK